MYYFFKKKNFIKRVNIEIKFCPVLGQTKNVNETPNPLLFS